MQAVLPVSFVAALAALILAESRKGPLVLRLRFGGDVKRELRWLAQYGQFTCSAVICLLIWRLDPQPTDSGGARWGLVFLAVISASILAFLLKRLTGRVRPGYERAGRFLGPNWKHGPDTESFPSSHTAAAFAMTAILAWLYPPAAPIVWTLASICGVLRFLVEAHWPSDILAGAALGYAAAWSLWRLMERGVI